MEVSKLGYFLIILFSWLATAHSNCTWTVTDKLQDGCKYDDLTIGPSDLFQEQEEYKKDICDKNVTWLIPGYIRFNYGPENDAKTNDSRHSYLLIAIDEKNQLIGMTSQLTKSQNTTSNWTFVSPKINPNIKNLAPWSDLSSKPGTHKVNYFVFGLYRENTTLPLNFPNPNATSFKFDEWANSTKDIKICGPIAGATVTLQVPQKPTDPKESPHPQHQTAEDCGSNLWWWIATILLVIISLISIVGHVLRSKYKV